MTAISGALAALVVALPAQSAKPTHDVFVAKCNKVERSAAFLATMRAVKDSERMSMRFKLLERILPGRLFEPLTVPGLDIWHKSRPGVRRFSFRQRVRALEEAAVYKVAVEFRWFDADGELLRQNVKRSPRCRQPGALPNLRVQRIMRRPNGQYLVRVGNFGRDAAEPASVQLIVDGQDVGTRELPQIAVDGFAWAAFAGDPCVNSVQAIVDPSAAVRESAEDDNALTVPCAELR